MDEVQVFMSDHSGERPGSTDAISTPIQMKVNVCGGVDLNIGHSSASFLRRLEEVHERIFKEDDRSTWKNPLRR